MAELTNTTASTPSSACCDAERQTVCCEPSEQADCCGSSEQADRCGPSEQADRATPAATSCGCSAASTTVADDHIRELVRERYAAAAGGSICCDPTTRNTDAGGAEVFGGALYGEHGADAPDAALAASLGCGVPTAVADLHPGETVLDLGSGAGADVLISARRVGRSGRAIGIDMTDEMLALARANAAQAGVENVEFIKGYLEELPLPDASIDVVISNCVINLAADKRLVIREAARVLRPGGRLAVSDVIADPELDDATRADMAAWTGCIAGALTEAEFRGALLDAGFDEIEIRPTHDVHQQATAAIVRARKPLAPTAVPNAP